MVPATIKNQNTLFFPEIKNDTILGMVKIMVDNIVIVCIQPIIPVLSPRFCD
ncbi:hypothetical protein BXY64_3982 [Marinifilum flexuosum]|uniref:Uncharacterized protein n=1 Tax=Marinifilum flexuosum TaxID=1117708 RepID=A0A419WNP7_9BACT|nr:hypothetical protein BXY64_3982 [Marinifilum flexuosum]